MRILIRVSEIMNEKAGYLGSLEDRYIRVPSELRDICQLEEGEFVSLRVKTGEIVTLQASTAYKEDVLDDPLSAYVTREIFNTLHLTEEIKKYEQEVDIVDNITLGCDPEFFLVNKQTAGVIQAYRLFKKFGDVGHDGVLMEVRPLPSTNEIVVTNNIYNLIGKARKKIDEHKKIDGSNVTMVAASHYGGLAAGFHLHFGLPSQILGVNRKPRKAFQKQIVRALDYYVGIPAIIPEGEEDYVRRSAPHIVYGKPGEMRVDNRTLEYRVPGGSLMRHPVLTVGILGLGAIVIEDAVSRMKMCTDSFGKLEDVSSPEHLKDIYPNIPDVFELYKIICSKDLTLARKHIDIITNDITQMVGFEKRKSSIEQFFRCIYDGTKFSHDIEENWNGFYNRRVFQNAEFA